MLTHTRVVYDIFILHVLQLIPIYISCDMSNNINTLVSSRMTIKYRDFLTDIYTFSNKVLIDFMFNE